MKIRVAVLITILLTPGLFTIANVAALPGSLKIPYFENVQIHSEEQLREFVLANHFPGKGTPQDPYILSFNTYRLILENVSSSITFLNCNVGTGHINITNVENLKIENSTLHGEIIFANTRNIIFSNVSIGYSYFFFQNSSDVQIENSICETGPHFKNMKNLYIDNVHFKDGGYILMDNVRYVYINSTSPSVFDIDHSEKIHIFKANMTERGNFDMANSREISVENSTISEPCVVDVSNLTMTNLNVLGEMEIKGIKRISEGIKIQDSRIDMLIMMKNVKNVNVQNMKIEYESKWSLNTAISMNNGNDVILRNIFIRGTYEKGIYVNRSRNIRIENSKISINYTKNIENPYSNIVERRKMAVGLVLRNSKYIIVRNSTFNNSQSIGIKIVNGEHIGIENNKFGYQISTPIEIDGSTRFLLLRGNSRGSGNHPVGLDIFLLIIILLALLILGKYPIKRSTEDYYERKINYEVESIREKL